MENIVIYIHGKDGVSNEARHYIPLFPGYDVIGFDYDSKTPWDAKIEFGFFINLISQRYKHIVIIANSIGAFFALNSLNDRRIDKAYLISPIVNMEKLIEDMLVWSGNTEEGLKEKGTIETEFGETLSYEYLTWIRNNPYEWNVPTEILYGSLDTLQTIDTIKEFCEKTSSTLTVMDNGEHWFHTEEQMKFLDSWIKKSN